MTTKTNGHKSNGHIRTKIRKIYNRDKHKIAQAATAISHAAKNAKDKFDDVEESVEKFAKANPWKTIGMSLLAGVIVGKIVNK